MTKPNTESPPVLLAKPSPDGATVTFVPLDPAARDALAAAITRATDLPDALTDTIADGMAGRVLRLPGRTAEAVIKDLRRGRRHIVRVIRP